MPVVKLLVCLIFLSVGQCQEPDCSKTFEECAKIDPPHCTALSVKSDVYPECLQDHAFSADCKCTCLIVGPECQKDQEDEKNDSGDNNDNGGDGDDAAKCLHGDSIITTEVGPMAIRDLVKMQGVKIQGLDERQQPVMTDVIYWGHVEPQKKVEYVEFHMESGHTLPMTPLHIAHVVPCQGGPIASKHASAVKAGECMLVYHNGQLEPSPVVDIKQVQKTGFYWFMAGTTTVIVDDVAVSTIASVEGETIVRLWGKAMQTIFNFLPVQFRNLAHIAIDETIAMLRMGTYFFS